MKKFALIIFLLSATILSARENYRWVRITGNAAPVTHLHQLSGSSQQGTSYRIKYGPEPSKQLEKLVNRHFPEADPPASFSEDIVSISRTTLFLEKLLVESIQGHIPQQTDDQRSIAIDVATYSESLFRR